MLTRSDAIAARTGSAGIVRNRLARATALSRSVPYVAVTLIGLLVRLITMRQYAGHIDEPASLMALHRVADIGAPIFPSGVLYLQGAIFSYFGAPLAWIFSGDALFNASRVFSLLLSMALIPLSMKLVTYICGELWPAVLAGLIIAFDPSLITWSVTLRPYGMLSATVVATLLLFLVLVKNGPQARIPLLGRVVILLPIVIMLGTFTHIGFWIVLPALYIIAAIVWRSSLFSSHRDILVSGIVSAFSLAAYMLLGRFVGTGAGTGGGGVINSFVGSHLLNRENHPETPLFDWRIWHRNFNAGELRELMPLVVMLASAVLVWALFSSSNDAAHRWRNHAIATLLLAHWVAIIAVTLLVSTDPNPRYLNHIIAPGYILLSIAIWFVWRGLSQYSATSRSLLRWTAILVILLPLAFHSVTAASWRMQTPGGQPDYWHATAWAAENRTDGQVVILTLPTSAYFWFDESEYNDLIFLAGSEDSPRTDRYIKPNLDGEQGDYWLGVASIGSRAQLCSALSANAGNALIVVDQGRLFAGWALYGDMSTAIRGSSTEVYSGPAGMQVLSVVPVDAWTPQARDVCGLE